MAKIVNRGVKIFIDDREVQKNIGSVSKEFKKLNRDIKKMEEGSEEYLETMEAIGQLGGMLNKHRKNIRQVSQAYDELNEKPKGFLDGLRNIATKAGDFLGKSGLGGIASVAGGALTAIGLGAAKAADEIKQTADEINGLTQVTNQFFDDTGNNIDKITNKSIVLGTAFDTDKESIIEAANAASKGFGVDGVKSINNLEKAFDKVPTKAGEIVDITREYSDQIHDAGLEQESFLAIATTSIKDGFYSDKGIDSLKEGLIRIREMTPATEKAITDIGLSSKSIEEGIKNGTLTVFDALQQISTRVKEFPETGREVGAIFADVFGGAGEDASKRFIFGLDSIETKLDNIPDSINENTRSQKAWTEQWVIFVSTTLKADELITKITSGIRRWGTEQLKIINGNQEVNESLAETVDTSTEYIATNQALIDEYQALSEKENQSVEDKARLSQVQDSLIQNFGESVIVIDQETGALSLNTAEIIRQIQVRQALQSEGVQQLLADKLRLETQIRLAGEATDKLQNLATELGVTSDRTSAWGIILDNAANGTLFLTQTNNDLEAQLLQGALTQDEFNAKLAALTPTLVDVAAKVGFVNANEAQLEATQRALINSGIDLDEIAKQSIETTSSSTIATSANSEQLEAAKTTIEQLRKAYENLKKTIDNLEEGFNISQLTGIDKELAKLQGKFDPIIAKIDSTIEQFSDQGKQLTTEETEIINSLLIERNRIIRLRSNEQQQLLEEFNKKEQQTRLEALDEIANILASEEDLEIKTTEEKYEKLLQLARQYGGDVVALQQKLADEIAAIRESHQDAQVSDFLGLSTDQLDQLQEGIAIAETLVGDLGTTLSNFGQIRANEEKGALQQLESNTNKRIEHIQNLASTKVISEESANRQIAETEATLAKQRSDFAIKQAVAEKDAKIRQARTDEALGLIKIWTQNATNPAGIPLAIALSAGLLAVTESNIAKIKSEPLPVAAFATGGFINQPTMALMGERGQEVVFSNQMLKNGLTGPILKNLEAIQSGTSTANTRPNFAAMQQAVSSTSVSGTSTDNSQLVAIQNKLIAQNVEMLEEQKRMNTLLLDPVNRQAYIKSNTLEDFEEDKEVIARLADF